MSVCAATQAPFLTLPVRPTITVVIVNKNESREYRNDENLIKF